MYLSDIIRPSNVEVPKSLLLFPLHSHEWVDFREPVVTHLRYIKEIKKINHLFEDISVSLGWKEYQNQDIIELFLENGIKSYYGT